MDGGPLQYAFDKESIMAARTTRQAARARIMAAFEKALDRIIPIDEAQALKGRTFVEWENQADAFDAAVTGTLLEERAALEDTARVEAEGLGHCAHCGSDRLYLQRSEFGNKEVRTPHGPVVLGHQSIRCRACGRSFSPSGS
jgi:hypothetical protein